MRHALVHRRSGLALIAIAAILTLAGCGGSSGSTGGGGGQGGAGQHQLGSRGVPGGTVAVSTADALSAGHSATFHVALSGFPSAPQSVGLRIGADYVDDAVMVPASAAGGGFDATLTLPDTAQGVWVRLVFADGSVIETGAKDFPLGG